MADASNTLLKLIHDTKAVSIWNHQTGPVFWYAASVPGPFYVNTELVIGPALATELLEKITTIIAATTDNAARAAQLDKAMMDAYHSSAQYRQVIAAMAEAAASEFPAGSYDLISGGERRDWLFSIPLAYLLKTKHVYLFKNQTFYSSTGITNGERALHVADLINNAASYFDLWFPILAKANLNYIGTVCINSRGSNGLNRLKEHGKKTVTLNSVDLSFFDKSLASGLITKDTRDEIAAYFDNSSEWAKRYLMQDVKLYAVSKLTAKDFERLQAFFNNDPWHLKLTHAAFFAAMQAEIAKRKAG